MTVLVVLLHAPSDVHAECGSYVTIGNPSDAAKANLGSAAREMTTHGDPGDPHSGQKPCNGPQCRGSEPRPLAPSPPPVSTGQHDHVAVLTGVTCPITHSHLRFTSDERLQLLAGHLLADDPPPRD